MGSIKDEEWDIPKATVKADIAVKHPKHYDIFPELECIKLIAYALTTEQFYGYCLGNYLKYRTRLGAKDDLMQDYHKSNEYKELYLKYVHLTRDYGND